MRSTGRLAGSFLLFLLTILLPWFTFNAKIMGYCWGWHFLKWLIVPIIIIAIYLFLAKGAMLAALAELSAAIILVVYVIAFGHWQAVYHIAPGFQWLEGFYTATAGYWISLATFFLFAVELQLQIFRKKRAA